MGKEVNGVSRSRFEVRTASKITPSFTVLTAISEDRCIRWVLGACLSKLSAVSSLFVCSSVFPPRPSCLYEHFNTNTSINLSYKPPQTQTMSLWGIQMISTGLLVDFILLLSFPSFVLSIKTNPPHVSLSHTHTETFNPNPEKTHGLIHFKHQISSCAEFHHKPDCCKADARAHARTHTLVRPRIIKKEEEHIIQKCDISV